MSGLDRIEWMWKAAAEIGLRKSSQYALYRFGLAIGHYRRSLRANVRSAPQPGQFKPIFQPTDRGVLTATFSKHPESMDDVPRISAGQYRPYGGAWTPIDLSVPNPDLDWTEWHFPEELQANDIKDIWEPARLGWLVTLARSIRVIGDERISDVFWKYVEDFVRINPPYYGPNWISAQEAAIRIIHLCFSGGEFWPSVRSTLERKELLAATIAQHAMRIPITMVYARAQGNNHLLSEAAGLYTAGCCLPDHPRAKEWREQGWREFEAGILDQIIEDGTYSQHSVCYHRMMLTLALWMNAIHGENHFSDPVIAKLQAASRWLERMTSGLDGCTPNLGSNDGTLILPLGDDRFERINGVAQTAMMVFCNKIPEHPGEFTAWMGLPLAGNARIFNKPVIKSEYRIDSDSSVGFLRTAEYTSRPAQADQLHFDLWWQGQNILRDAGTYRYNAPSPWENGLAGTDVHNTVSMDGRDQMTRAGKFLWEDWAQARVVRDDLAGDTFPRRISAAQDGYRKLGVLHTRIVELHGPDEWLISDRLDPVGKQVGEHSFRLQWLLPDAEPFINGVGGDGWYWQMQDNILTISSKLGIVHIEVKTAPGDIKPGMHIYRMGELLAGTEAARPTWGWYSPTYGVKEPAISLAVTLTARPPAVFVTSIHLQKTVIPVV
jgi:hypothetical protein